MKKEPTRPEYSYVIPGHIPIITGTTKGHLSSNDTATLRCGSMNALEVGCWLDETFPPETWDGTCNIKELEDALEQSKVETEKVFLTIKAEETDWHTEKSLVEEGIIFEDQDTFLPHKATITVINGEIQVAVAGLFPEKPKTFTNVLDFLHALVNNDPVAVETPKKTRHTAFHKAVIPHKSIKRNEEIIVQDNTPLYLTPEGSVLLGEDWKSHYSFPVTRISVAELLEKKIVRSQDVTLPDTTTIQSAVVLSDDGHVFVFRTDIRKMMEIAIGILDTANRLVCEAINNQESVAQTTEQQDNIIERMIKAEKEGMKMADVVQKKVNIIQKGTSEELLQLVSRDITKWTEQSEIEIWSLRGMGEQVRRSLKNDKGEEHQLKTLMKLIHDKKFSDILCPETPEREGDLCKLPWKLFAGIKEYIDWKGVDFKGRAIERKYVQE
jgi:hypothetical protein